MSPCDAGALKSPGADIDSAQLDAGPYLAACVLTGTTACENSSANAANAEGPPDATGKEEEGTYTAMNGGMLRCSWGDGSGDIGAGNTSTIHVIEIGSASGTNVEQFRIRLCSSLGQCGPFSSYTSGEVEFSANDLF